MNPVKQKKNLKIFKGKINKATVLVGDFKPTLPDIDRSSRQKTLVRMQSFENQI